MIHVDVARLSAKVEWLTAGSERDIYMFDGGAVSAPHSKGGVSSTQAINMNTQELLLAFLAIFDTHFMTKQSNFA